MPRSSSAVAVAAVVHSVHPHSNDSLCKSPSSSIGFGVLPVEREGPGMFLTEPSLASLASWVTSVVQPSSVLLSNSSSSRIAAPNIPLLPPLPRLLLSHAPVPVVLFVPLSVTSLVAKECTTGMKLDKEKRRLRKCCEESNIAGISLNVRHEDIFEPTQTAAFYSLNSLTSLSLTLLPRILDVQGCLDDRVCELRQAQETMSVLGALYRPLFPVALGGLKKELARIGASGGQPGVPVVVESSAVCEGDDEADTHTIMRRGCLYDAVPLFKMHLGPLSAESAALAVALSLAVEGTKERGEGETSGIEGSSSSSSSSSDESDSDDDSNGDSDDSSASDATCSDDNSDNTNTNSNSDSNSKEDKADGSFAVNVTTTQILPAPAPAPSPGPASCSSSNNSSSRPLFLLCSNRARPLTRLALRIRDKVALITHITGYREGVLVKHSIAPLPLSSTALGVSSAVSGVGNGSIHNGRNGDGAEVVPADLAVGLTGVGDGTETEIKEKVESGGVGSYSSTDCDEEHDKKRNGKTHCVVDSSSREKDVSSGNTTGHVHAASSSLEGSGAAVAGNASAASHLRLQLLQRKRRRPSNGTESDLPDVPAMTSGALPAISRNTQCTVVGAASSTDQKADSERTLEVTRNVESVVQGALLESPSLSVPPPAPSDVTVTFLGTGSATPSKHRNNSCIVLYIPISDTVQGPPLAHTEGSTLAVPVSVQQGRVGHIVLLDAGEGASVQLYQSCGGDAGRFNTALLSIRMVWISHHHADHICGLPLLLEHVNRALLLRRKAQGHGQGLCGAVEITRFPPFSKIVVIAPPVVLKYYEYCACVAGLDDLVTFVPTVSTLFASYSVPLPLGMKILVRSVQVMHCKESYAIVLDIQSTNTPTKIVYSGDCRPSSALINAGKNCDLLLHEATFDDTMQSDAECKRHCTTSEAVAVGVRMRAKHIVLTHFSQRYPTTVQSFTGSKVPAPTQGQGPKQEQGSGPSSNTGPSSGRESGQTISTNRNSSNNNGNTSSSTETVGVIKAPYSVAFDLLHFSFPSQVHCLPAVTSAISQSLAAVAASEKESLE
jgi:ribonuclease BN (tRNA processing enzyme)